MASVYTISGSRRKKRSSKGLTKQQRKMKSAAKKCKGQTRSKFRACMKRELKK
jgi:hypothetical protein